MANPLDSFKQLPPWGKAAVAAGGAGVVFLVWRARQNAAAAPASGLSTPDAAAGAGTGDGFPVSSGTSGTLGTTSGYGDNAAWSQAAQAGLSEVGFDSLAVAAALGAYLGGQRLTAGQASIVYAAIAEFGLPPVNPPPVVLTGGKPVASTGNTTPSVSGGHVVSVSNNEAVVGWAGKNAKSYRVTIHGPGPLNGRQDTVTAAQATYGGLEAGHKYDVTVVPVGADGRTGHAGTVTFKTTKGK